MNKTDKNTNNNLIFKQIFCEHLSQIITKINYDKGKTYHHLALKGFVETTFKIYYKCLLARRHIDQNGKKVFDGYHIYCNDLKVLRMNKIYIDLNDELFIRKSNSTYHSNNKIYGKSNGYSHWYDFSYFLRQVIKGFRHKFIEYYKFNSKYQSVLQSYYNKTEKILATTQNNISNKDSIGSIFKIKKSILRNEWRLFIRFKNDQFPFILNHILYWDDEYVYVNNIINGNDEYLDNLGRIYTLLGLLKKDFRERILKGYTEFDLNCSIQTLLINGFYMNSFIQSKNIDLTTFKIDFPEHYQLLYNKKIYRLIIGNCFDTTEDIGKKIITHCSYSPKSNFSYSYLKNKSPKTKKLSKIRIQKFIDEVVEIRKVVLSKFYYQNDDLNPNIKIGDLKLSDFPRLIDEGIKQTNIKKNIGGRGKKKEDRIIFRINELLEHQIRKCLIQYLSTFNGNNIYQIHDAVIFKNTMNILSADLEQIIYNKLRFVVKFETKEY